MGGGATAYVSSDTTSSTSLSSSSNDSSGTLTFDSSQLGAYANFSVALSDISSSQTLTSTTTFNSSAQDSWSASGTGTTTYNDTTQGTGTLGYNTGLTSGNDLATLTDGHSSQGSDSTVYSSATRDDASQSQQGSFAQGSFALSSFAQDDFQSTTFEEQQGSLSSSFQSQSGTATGTLTLAGTASYLGSSNATDTATYSRILSGWTSDTSTGSLSETGAQTVSSHQEGSLDPVRGLTLTALSLDQSTSFTFTSLRTDNPGSDSVVVTTSNENAFGNGAGCFGGASGNQFLSGSSSATETVSALSGALVTSQASGSDSMTFHEAGSYANFSYSLTSLGYSEGESQTGTLTQSTTDSRIRDAVVTAFTNSSNGLNDVYGQGGFYAGGLSGTGSFGGGGSSMTWSTQTVSDDTSDSAEATFTSSSGWTLSQQGQYAGGSYALSSQTYDQSASATFSSSDTATDSQTVQSLATFTATSNFTRSSTSSGSDSSTLHQEGTFSNFSLSLGCFLYQAGVSSSGSFTETGGSSSTGTSSSLTTSSSSDTGTLGAPAGLACMAASGGKTTSGTSSDSHTSNATEAYGRAATSTVTQAVLEAGSYVGGSYTLSLYSQTFSATDSYALTESATATTSGSASAASLLTNTTSGNALMCTLSRTAAPQSGNQSGWSTSSMTESYNYLATASYSLSQSGSDTTVLSQSGDYANFSLALNAVTDNESAESSYTFSQDALESVAGMVVLGGNGSGSQSSSASQQGGMFIAGQAQLATANSSFGGTYSYSALNTQSTSQASAGSYALYQSGVMAGGLYAFGSFSLDQSAQSSFSSSQSASQTALSSATGTMASSNCLTLSTAGPQPATNETGLSQAAGSVSVLATWSLNGSLSCFASDSYASHRAGSFANGDYSLDSVAYDEQSLASSAQSYSTTFTQWSQQVAQTTVSVTDYGSLGPSSPGNSGTITNSSHSTETATESTSAYQSYQEDSAQTATWHEEGSYAGGSFALSSAVYTGSGTDSFHRGVSSSDTVAVDGSSDSFNGGSNASTSTGGQGSGSYTGYGNYSRTGAVSSFNAEDSSDSFGLYQAGVYAGGSYALSSFSSSEGSLDSTEAGGTLTRSSGADLEFSGTATGFNPDITQAAMGAGGSGTGGSGPPPGPGTFTGTGEALTGSSVTSTYYTTAQSTYSLAEAGTYAGGSYALSYFLLDSRSTDATTASQDSLASATAEGSGSEGFTFTSQGTFSQSASSGDANVLHEEGTWTQAEGFSLSCVLSDETSSSSADREQSSLATLDGSSNSGTASGAESLTASSASSLYQAGTYGEGSYALSSFVQDDSDSQEEGSASTWMRSGTFLGLSFSGSFTQSQSSTEEDSTYATGSTVLEESWFGGSYPTFSYSSYSYSGSSADTHTEESVNAGPGYTVTHGLTETDSTEEEQSGSGQTATWDESSLGTTVNHDHIDWVGHSWDSLTTESMPEEMPGGTMTLADPVELEDADSQGLSLPGLPASPVVSGLGTAAAVPGGPAAGQAGAGADELSSSSAVLVAGQGAASSPVVEASGAGQRLGLPQPVVLTPQQMGLDASQLMRLMGTATQPQSLSNPLADRAKAAMQQASEAAAQAALARRARQLQRQMKADDLMERQRAQWDYAALTGQPLRLGDALVRGSDGKSNAFQAAKEAAGQIETLGLYTLAGVSAAGIVVAGMTAGPLAVLGSMLKGFSFGAGLSMVQDVLKGVDTNLKNISKGGTWNGELLRPDPFKALQMGTVGGVAAPLMLVPGPNVALHGVFTGMTAASAVDNIKKGNYFSAAFDLVLLGQMVLPAGMKPTDSLGAGGKWALGKVFGRSSEPVVDLATPKQLGKLSGAGDVDLSGPGLGWGRGGTGLRGGAGSKSPWDVPAGGKLGSGEPVGARGGILEPGSQPLRSRMPAASDNTGFHNCFLADTLVATEDAAKPIQAVHALERVWAFDLLSGEWKLCLVAETFARRYEGRLVSVSAAGESIRATSGHPFWVVEGQDLAARPWGEHIPELLGPCRVPGRWVDAGDLQVGDVLLLKDGRRAAVTELVSWQACVEVFNFRVEGLACYVVGANQILVHNNSGPNPPAGRPLQQGSLFPTGGDPLAPRGGVADANRFPNGRAPEPPQRGSVAEAPNRWGQNGPPSQLPDTLPGEPAPQTGRGSQAAFSRSAEDLVSDHIGIPRNTLGKAGDTIPGSGAGGVRYPEYPVHGPNGTLAKRGSIVEVKASHSGDPRSGLSTRDRAQIRDYIEYARALRQRAATETDPVLRAQLEKAKVELFTDYPKPTRGEFKQYLEGANPILEWKPIPGR